MTYAVLGGVGMAVLGSPVIAICAGAKAAFSGAVGLGTIGAFTGSIYASKINRKLDEENQEDKKERLLNDDDSMKEDGIKMKEKTKKPKIQPFSTFFRDAMKR